MKERKPIRRNPALQPFSRDHHHLLMLCWKIRKGFSKEVSPQRMKSYTDWFFDRYLLPHFRLEEKFVFPVLGSQHEMVKKALAEHRRLKRLFKSADEPERSLSQLEEELERHIRFEERQLYGEVERNASSELLAEIANHHGNAPFEENQLDEFWK